MADHEDVIVGDRPPVAPDRVEQVFVPQAEVLATARAIVARTLTDWQCAPLVADAAVVVVELATNAIRHARSPFVLRLIRTRSGVRVEVQDASDRPPAYLPSDRRRIGGRGIQIVDSIARSWGSHPEAGGKIVWAELDAPVEQRWAS